MNSEGGRQLGLSEDAAVWRTKEHRRVDRQVTADADAPDGGEGAQRDVAGRAACRDGEDAGYEERRVECPSEQSC